MKEDTITEQRSYEKLIEQKGDLDNLCSLTANQLVNCVNLVIQSEYFKINAKNPVSRHL